jgi:hypothetical protein
LRFGNPGKNASESFEAATLKGLRHGPSSRIQSQLLQSCDQINVSFTQGFKATPGLKLANAFSVIIALQKLSIGPVATTTPRGLPALLPE